MNPVQRTISFPNRSSAFVVEAPAGASGDELLARLGLPPPRGTVIVNGSTADVAPPNRARVTDALVNGVAQVAVAERLTVVTGGTDAGIFAILGAALAHSSEPLVGVVPAHLVTWPGRHRHGDDRTPLEPHHSHFVLVDGQEWGDETGTLLALATALAKVAPCVAVLCGGGAGARDEALGHSRSGRELVVIAGSGRFADELAQATRAIAPLDDPVVAEILADGKVTVCRTGADGPAIAEILHVALFGDRH